MVIFCSAIIHENLTTMEISNQDSDAIHGPARPANNMQTRECRTRVESCTSSWENHRKRSVLADGRFLNVRPREDNKSPGYCLGEEQHSLEEANLRSQPHCNHGQTTKMSLCIPPSNYTQMQ